MRAPLASILVFATLLAAPAMAHALMVPLNHSARLVIPGAAGSVLVGNPAIADVTVVDSHTVYVMGRGYGSTDVVVLDRGGHTLYSGEVTVAATGRTVSVYRGPDRSTYACGQGCSVYSDLPHQEAKFGAAAGAASPPPAAPDAAPGAQP